MPRIVALDGVVPEFPEVGVFSLIMHTFFVLFNAAIGVVFLPRPTPNCSIRGGLISVL